MPLAGPVSTPSASASGIPARTPSGNGSNFVYDNYPTGNLYNDPLGTQLGGGEIKLHSSNQTAAGGPGHRSDVGPALTLEQLRPIVTEAIARWQEAGATPAQLAPLEHLTYQIVSLNPGILAMTGPDTVWISPDAAGYGWFIDPTPANDAAFSGVLESPAQNRMDLLSVMAHELGHIVLRMDESAAANDVMTEALPLGVRRLPTPDDLGLKPSAAWAGSHNSLGLKEPAAGREAALAARVDPGVLDRLFAAALDSPGSSLASRAPKLEVSAPGAAASTMTNRQFVRPRHGVLDGAMNPWLDGTLGDGLADQLAHELAR